MAGAEGLEPQPMVLETSTLPIELCPYNGVTSGDRTHAITEPQSAVDRFTIATIL